MRFAVISIAVLTILKLNSPTPILEPHRIAKSDSVVASFVKQDVIYHTPDFVDMKPINDIANQKLQEAENKRQQEANRLQALEAQKQQEQVQVSTMAQNTPVTPTNGSDNEYKLYIYNHESGNNPARYNSSGCLGLGQACPASKLLAVCPVITDYACQDAFFTNYALARYGSWEAALAFWQAHRWW